MRDGRIRVQVEEIGRLLAVIRRTESEVVQKVRDVQRTRVLARPGMSEAKFAAILARQMPDAEKRARANYVIETGGSLDGTRAQVRALLAALRG